MFNRVLVFVLMTLSVPALQESIEDRDDSLCGTDWSMICNGCNSMTLCMPSGSMKMFCTDGTPYCVDGADGFATCSESPTTGCEPTTLGTTTEDSETETSTVEPTAEDSTTVDTTTPLETTDSTTLELPTSTEPQIPLKPVPAMRCTGPGLFPDPRDCNAYHYCFAKGDQSYTLRCPEGSFYDYSSQNCKELTSPSECLSIRCDPHKVFQKYDAEGQYFGVCTLGTIAVYRCPAAIDDVGSCPFACTKEGFFTNPLEPSTYIHCWRMYGARSLSMRLLYCPTWWEFDEKVQRCVFKKDL